MMKTAWFGLVTLSFVLALSARADSNVPNPKWFCEAASCPKVEIQAPAFRTETRIKNVFKTVSGKKIQSSDVSCGAYGSTANQAAKALAAIMTQEPNCKGCVLLSGLCTGPAGASKRVSEVYTPDPPAKGSGTSRSASE
jgi:hypothetical protein